MVNLFFFLRGMTFGGWGKLDSHENLAPGNEVGVVYPTIHQVSYIPGHS